MGKKRSIQLPNSKLEDAGGDAPDNDREFPDSFAEDARSAFAQECRAATGQEKNAEFFGCGA